MIIKKINDYFSIFLNYDKKFIISYIFTKENNYGNFVTCTSNIKSEIVGKIKNIKIAKIFDILFDDNLCIKKIFVKNNIFNILEYSIEIINRGCIINSKYKIYVETMRKIGEYNLYKLIVNNREYIITYNEKLYNIIYEYLNADFLYNLQWRKYPLIYGIQKKISTNNFIAIVKFINMFYNYNNNYKEMISKHLNKNIWNSKNEKKIYKYHIKKMFCSVMKRCIKYGNYSDINILFL
jgi:hypothetical protein